MSSFSDIAEVLECGEMVDNVEKNEAKAMVETALSIASSSGGEEWLAELQAEVIFGRGPAHRFAAVKIERRGQGGAPEDAEEVEARGEAREHLVVPELMTNTVSICRLRRSI
jgi:hypothetical protein